MNDRQKIRWQGVVDGRNARLVLLEHISNGRFIIQTSRTHENAVESTIVWDDVKPVSGGCSYGPGESEYSRLLTAIVTNIFQQEYKASAPQAAA